MKKYFLVIYLLSSLPSYTQMLSEKSMLDIKVIENNIKSYAKNIVYAEDWLDRFKADSAFTRGLVQALKQPYSFYYNFDSIETISKLYAPDSSFKIFTWQISKDLNYYRQKGAIQMNTTDGSLKLFPLFDFSEFTNNPVDSVRNSGHWIGAMYYKIILKKFNNKNYYTLLGLDENNARSSKKWIEVLTFNENNEPQFGGRFFNYPANDKTKPPQPAYRFCLEFKKDGGARMNYDSRYDEIIFDHLSSESSEDNGKHNLVPYGDYEGFKWINGTWTFVKNPFANAVFDENQSALPNALLDEKGNRIEKKLDDASKKNQQKQLPKKEDNLFK
jgi:hypothetical protein